MPKVSRQNMEHINVKKFSVMDQQITVTPAELNGALDGNTATAAELSKLHDTGANVTAATLAALTGGGNIAAAAGGHGHALAAGATDVTATAAQVNTLARHPGTPAVAVIDFNTGAAEAGCKITIGGVDYQEADAADAPNGVWTNGASAADSAASFLAAINGDTRNGGSPFTGVAAAGAHSVILTADAVGTAGNAVITTTSANNVTVENAHGGTDAALKQVVAVNYVVTAQDALAAEVNIALPFAPTAWVMGLFTTAGVVNPTTWLATVQTTPNRIRIAADGATALIAGDIVQLWAMS